LRLLIALILIHTALTAQQLILKSVSDDYTTATAITPKIERGITAFIIKHYSPAYSAIVARAVVLDYNDTTNISTLALSPFDTLQQDSLPKIVDRAESSDELLLAPDYMRAMLIAPNYDIYNKITSNITDTYWVHPDLLATYLSYQSHSTPELSDFKELCEKYVIGLLYIYLSDTLYTLDCHTFTTLHTTKVGASYTDTDLPFFHRIGKIDEGLFSFGGSGLKEYEPYYKSLIER